MYQIARLRFAPLKFLKRNQEKNRKKKRKKESQIIRAVERTCQGFWVKNFAIGRLMIWRFMIDDLGILDLCIGIIEQKFLSKTRRA